MSYVVTACINKFINKSHKSLFPISSVAVEVEQEKAESKLLK